MVKAGRNCFTSIGDLCLCFCSWSPYSLGMKCLNCLWMVLECIRALGYEGWFCGVFCIEASTVRSDGQKVIDVKDEECVCVWGRGWGNKIKPWSTPSLVKNRIESSENISCKDVISQEATGRGDRMNHSDKGFVCQVQLKILFTSNATILFSQGQMLIGQ